MKKETDENKARFIENLAKLFVHVTDDAFERASRRAVLICFALKYFLSIGIYIALRNFIGYQFGELWIALVFAYALYGHELFINMKVKEGLVKSFLEEEHNDEEKDIENTDDTESTVEEEKD